MSNVTHLYIRIDREGTLINRALSTAARKGFNPLDSHAVQAGAFRYWAIRESRTAVETAGRRFR